MRVHRVMSGKTTWKAFAVLSASSTESIFVIIRCKQFISSWNLAPAVSLREKKMVAQTAQGSSSFATMNCIRTQLFNETNNKNLSPMTSFCIFFVCLFFVTLCSLPLWWLSCGAIVKKPEQEPKRKKKIKIIYSMACWAFKRTRTHTRSACRRLTK